MKKALAVALALTSTCAFAQQAPTENGFSGNILLGAISVESKNNFANFDDDNLQAKGLNSKPKAYDMTVPVILGSANFTFGQHNHQLFLSSGTSRVMKGDFAQEIGYRYFGDGHSSYTIAVIPDASSETFEDPYKTNGNRTVTDKTVSAVRARADLFWGPFSIEVASATTEIDTERSGHSLSITPGQRRSLDRNGDTTMLGVDMMLPITDSFFIRPGVYAYDTETDGAAGTHQSVSLETDFIFHSGRHSLIASIAVEDYSYDIDDPVFNRERDDTQARIFAMYFFSEPFGWENFSLFALATAKTRDSNINYYYQESAVSGVGLSYKF